MPDGFREPNRFVLRGPFDNVVQGLAVICVQSLQMFYSTEYGALQTIKSIVLIEPFPIGFFPQTSAVVQIELNGSYDGVCTQFASWGVYPSDVKSHSQSSFFSP
jgi:hypothetical protein